MIVELAKLEMEAHKEKSKALSPKERRRHALNIKEQSRKESAYLFAHKIAKEKAEAEAAQMFQGNINIDELYDGIARGQEVNSRGTGNIPELDMNIGQ